MQSQFQAAMMLVSNEWGWPVCEPREDCVAQAGEVVDGVTISKSRCVHIREVTDESIQQAFRTLFNDMARDIAGEPVPVFSVDASGMPVFTKGVTSDKRVLSCRVAAPGEGAKYLFTLRDEKTGVGFDAFVVARYRSTDYMLATAWGVAG